MNTSKMLALIGLNGAYASRYLMQNAKFLYKDGVRLSATDVLQVWVTSASGDLLAYDAARTQLLTDKIASARIG